MDTDVGGGTVGLLALDALDVDPKLGTVALDNLADLQRIHSEKISRLPKAQVSYLRVSMFIFKPKGYLFFLQTLFRIRIRSDPYHWPGSGSRSMFPDTDPGTQNK